MDIFSSDLQMQYQGQMTQERHIELAIDEGYTSLKGWDNIESETLIFANSIDYPLHSAPSGEDYQEEEFKKTEIYYFTPNMYDLGMTWSDFV